jgi:hypothetical protein
MSSTVFEIHYHDVSISFHLNYIAKSSTNLICFIQNGNDSRTGNTSVLPLNCSTSHTLNEEVMKDEDTIYAPTRVVCAYKLLHSRIF